MGILRAQTTFDDDSALARDRVVNVMHFEEQGIVPNYNNVLDMVEDFYTAVPSGGALAITSYYSSLLDGTATTKLYNLDNPEPRVPVAERDWTFTPATNTPLPREVAVCVSFHGLPTAGLPAARRRGRVYLGLLSTLAITTTGRPDTTFLTNCARSLRDLIAASDASVTNKFGVYSPTNNNFVQVTGGWVDNEWDTQRRRGGTPTVRTLVTSTTPA
jgi:hypothetical protein